MILKLAVPGQLHCLQYNISETVCRSTIANTIYIIHHYCLVNNRELSKQADVAVMDQACINSKLEPDTSTIDMP